MKADLATDLDLREPQLLKYYKNKNWGVSQKIDGHRILLSRTTMTNRNGLGYQSQKLVPLFQKFIPFDSLPGVWIFDGELVGRTYHIFDIAHGNTFGMPYADRYLFLQKLFELGIPENDHVKLVPFITGTTRDKLNFHMLCRQNLCEGIILRHVEGVYTPGKRNPNIIKFKFVNTANVIITKLNIDGKANCELSVFDNGKRVAVGKASTNGKGAVNIDDIWEVRYLNLGPGGRLVQPRLMRQRHDIPRYVCRFTDLRQMNREVLQVG